MKASFIAGVSEVKIFGDVIVSAGDIVPDGYAARRNVIK
jgi:hypothetical protein